MKVHRIQLCNLNSLYGEHSIDFETDLHGAGQFLIVGPTGSGKSTILDAVCLALFAVTPRLTGKKQTRAWEATDPREIMSYGTRESFAEVEFSKLEAQEGGGQVVTRYVARWSCGRKRTGSLRNAERSLCRRDPLSGELEPPLVSTHKVKQAHAVFDRVLEGMDVDQFKRAILLAQGQFSTFLKADERKREDILARLLDTKDYEAVGRETSRRWREAKKAFEKRTTELETLTEVERPAAEREADAVALQGASGRAEALGEASAARRRELEWLKGRDERAARRAAADESLLKARALVEAFGPSAARLEAHEACTASEPTLRRLEEAEAQVATRQGRVGEQEAALADARAAAATAAAARDKAEAALGAARVALEAARPEIDEAKRVRGFLREKQRDLAAVDVRLGAQQAAHAQAAEALSSLQAAVAELAAEHAQAKDAREAVGDGEGLAEQLSGLEASHAALLEGQAQRARREELLEGQAKALEALRAEVTAAREAVEVQRVALSASQAQLDHAARQVRECLKGAADTAAWRRDAAAQARDLRAEAEHVSTLRQAWGIYREATREAGQVDLEALGGQLKSARERVGALQETIEAEQARLEALDVDAARLGWHQRIASEREALEEGEACPLCGGAEHPLRDDALAAEADARVAAEVAELDAERLLLKASLETARTEYGGQQAAQATFAERLLSAQAERERWIERAAQAERDARVALTACGLGGLEALAEEALAARETHLRAERERLEGAEQTLIDAEGARKEADTEQREAERALARLDSELGKLEAKLEGLEREQERGRADAAVQDTALAELSGRLTLALSGAGLPVEGQRLGDALAAGRARVSAWKAAVTRVREAEEGLSAAVGRLSEASAEAAKAQGALEQTSARREALGGEVLALRLEAQSLLGGADPEVREAEGVTAVRAAEAEARARAATSDAARDLRARQEEGLRQLQAALEEGRAQIVERGEALEGALRTLGLPTRAALEEALLAPARAAALREERQALSDGRVACERAARDRLQDETDWGAQRPEGLAEAATVAEVAAQQGAAEQVWRDALGEVRAVEERLKADAAVAEKRAAHQSAYAEAESTFQRWDRLYRLIGRDNGLVFKRYVLALTLGQLIQRANSTFLYALTSRYRLVAARDAKGRPLLAFEILDRVQSNRRRSVSSLSGGETFLVSLGLALALASFRTSSMRIETLFLDEGLGTLDRETLDTAMAALTQLQAGGTQVGIITHVQGLQERIPVQVQVRPLGNGRSTIEFPEAYVPVSAAYERPVRGVSAPVTDVAAPTSSAEAEPGARPGLGARPSPQEIEQS